MLKTTPQKEKDTSFSKLQAKYGVRSPEQIKMRIIWLHLQQLTMAQFPGNDTKATLRRFDRDWKQCENNEKDF